jgi:pyruvate dehydrogenase (quinone)
MHSGDLTARRCASAHCDASHAADMLNAGSKLPFWPDGAVPRPVRKFLQLRKRSLRRSSNLCSAKRSPDDHPYTTGGIGLLGTAPSQEVRRVRYRHRRAASVPEFYPKPGQAKAVQIDLDPSRIDCATGGRRTGRALLGCLGRSADAHRKPT